MCSIAVFPLFRAAGRVNEHRLVLAVLLVYIPTGGAPIAIGEQTRDGRGADQSGGHYPGWYFCGALYMNPEKSVPNLRSETQYVDFDVKIPICCV